MLLKKLRFPLAGWAGGLAAALGLAWLWPAILPALVRVEHYYGVGPSLGQLVGMTLIVTSLPALIGGWLGSRIPREGGPTEQFIMAAVVGAVVTLPFGCLTLWAWTGW